MVDILPHVAGLLSGLGAQIEQSFTDTYVTFPLIVISSPSNVATTCGGAEMFSRITVQIDAYTLDKKSTMELAQSIDEIMIPAGFTRSIATPLTEDFAERYMMQYTCGVDHTHHTIIL